MYPDRTGLDITPRLGRRAKTQLGCPIRHQPILRGRDAERTHDRQRNREMRARGVAPPRYQFQALGTVDSGGSQAVGGRAKGISFSGRNSKRSSQRPPPPLPARCLRSDPLRASASPTHDRSGNLRTSAAAARPVGESGSLAAFPIHRPIAAGLLRRLRTEMTVLTGTG